MKQTKRFRKRYWVISALVLASVLVYFANASWLAPAPQGRPILVAQRGVHQVYLRAGIRNDTCTAERLASVPHTFIDNSLPSIRAASESGADVVEVDVRAAKDGEFVLFHDLALDCRTDGHGRVSDTGVAELKRLDIGHGYTADGGRTFPLRGLGKGLMPTLEEALRAFPDRRFMIQFKDNHAAHAEALVGYLEARGLADWGRLSFFGGNKSVQHLETLRPQAVTWTDRGAMKCAAGYLMLGWSGYVPQTCHGGLIMVPTNLRHLVWGWPNRFLHRMKQQGVMVLALGDLEKLSATGFSRLDTAEQLARLPADYDGMIWTDHIEKIGPLVRAAALRDSSGASVAAATAH